jgi:hypothetical protein
MGAVNFTLVRGVALLSLVVLGFLTLFLAVAASGAMALLAGCLCILNLALLSWWDTKHQAIRNLPFRLDGEPVGDEVRIPLNWTAVVSEACTLFVILVVLLAIALFALLSESWFGALIVGLVALRSSLALIHWFEGLKCALAMGCVCKVDGRGIAVAGFPFIAWCRVLAITSYEDHFDGATIRRLDLLHRPGGEFGRRSWRHWVFGPMIGLERSGTVLRLQINKWAVSVSTLDAVLKSFGQRHAPGFVSWANAQSGQSAVMQDLERARALELERERALRDRLAADGRELRGALGALKKQRAAARPEADGSSVVKGAVGAGSSNSEGRLTKTSKARTA